MKHLKAGRKFGRRKKQREALLKTMLGDLLTKKKITTTVAKAKELKSLAEKTIGQLKNPEFGRIARARLPRNVDAKTIRDLAAKTASRKSGYLCLVKKGARRSDGAPMAAIEIIEDKIVSEPTK
jgi:large subunit ribosomal protein L17